MFVLIDDRIEDFDLEAALPLLSEQRREQCLRFRYESGRKQNAASYLLLCRLLREHYGISELPVFEYGEHGKPSIAGHPDIFFNISHCREAVACVVSNKPVGIDIESVGRYRESVARYAMNDDELAAITQAPRPDLEFTRLWTQKEAFLKMTGTGINDNMRSVLTSDEARHCEFITTEGNGYVYSICKLT